jgi:hypothetical protein
MREGERMEKKINTHFAIMELKSLENCCSDIQYFLITHGNSLNAPSGS